MHDAKYLGPKFCAHKYHCCQQEVKINSCHRRFVVKVI